MESLRSADVAGIGIDQQERLDLRDTSDNATDSDKFPEMHTLHFANSHRDVGKQGLEVEVALGFVKTRNGRTGDDTYYLLSRCTGNPS